MDEFKILQMTRERPKRKKGWWKPVLRMSTVNRKPVKVSKHGNVDVVIHWKCHGIDQHGNRQKWTEITTTTPVWVETYDSDLFPSRIEYFTTRQIYPQDKFERQQS